jgi:hypothetical protein
VAKEPISITNAPVAQSDELPGRAKRYFISMMIRTFCFLGAVFTPNPWRWFLILGAVLLPYIAVVIANAGRENGEAASTLNIRKSIG